MQERLMQYKHGLIIIIALLMPTMATLGALIAPPILAVIDPVENSWKILWFLFVLQGVFLVWVKLQGNAVTGEPIRKYINSLPLPFWRKYYTDFNILIVANNLFWLLIILALIMLPYHELISIPLLILRTVELITSILIIQTIWINRRYEIFLLVVLLDVLVSSSVFIQNQLVAGLFIMASLAGFCILPLFLAKSRLFSFFRLPSLLEKNQYKKLKKNGFPIVTVQYSILTRNHLLATILRAVASVIFFIFGLCVIFWGNLNPLIISIIVLGANAFIISGLYKRLYEAHQHFTSYVNSLPVSKFFWMFSDSKLISSVTSVGAIIFASILVYYVKISFLEAILLILIQIPLIFSLYFTQNKIRNFGMAVSIVIVGLWGMLFILLTHYK